MSDVAAQQFRACPDGGKRSSNYGVPNKHSLPFAFSLSHPFPSPSQFLSALEEHHTFIIAICFWKYFPISFSTILSRHNCAEIVPLGSYKSVRGELLCRYAWARSLVPVHFFTISSQEERKNYFPHDMSPSRKRSGRSSAAECGEISPSAARRRVEQHQEPDAFVTILAESGCRLTPLSPVLLSRDLQQRLELRLKGNSPTAENFLAGLQSHIADEYNLHRSASAILLDEFVYELVLMSF